MIDFDKRAKDWDSPIRIECAKFVAETIRIRVPLSSRTNAFEYGCGTGLLGMELQPYLGHITMADSSREMLNVLEKKIAAAGITNITPRFLDLATNPLPADRFDLVAASMVIHHVPDTDKILADFYGLLESPGYLCVADLDSEDGSFHGEDFDGHQGFDRDELGEKAKRAGFENVRFTTVYQMKREIDGKQKPFPVFLMIAEKP